jgi:ribosomal protein S4
MIVATSMVGGPCSACAEHRPPLASEVVDHEPEKSIFIRQKRQIDHMKKRFLNRLKNRYLGKRFPENLVPKKAISNSDKNVLGLLALSSQRKGRNKSSPSLSRSANLSPQLKRGARNLHKRRLGLNCSSSLQIDTLERGSLTSTFDGNVDPLFLAPSLKEQVARNLASSKKEQVASNLTSRKTRKVVSLYSSSQLESALSRQQEKRFSAFLLQLMEKKKLRILYGNLSNRETNTLIVRAIKGRGRFSDVLFRLLESRLDVVVCKIGFFPTIPFARQWIHHGKVLVNNKIITLANYLLQPGDIISIPQPYQHLVHNCINQRVGGLSISLWEKLESQFQHTDKKEYSSLLASSKQAASSLTKINLLPLPWLEDLKGRSPTYRPATTELRGRKQGDSNPSIRTDRHREGVRGSIEGKETEHFKSAHLTLTQLIGGFVAIPTYRSDKRKPRLGGWQLDQKLVRNKLRAFSLKLPHVEVSYKLLKAIYLYPSQRAVFPATVDIEKILNS